MSTPTTRIRPETQEQLRTMYGATGEKFIDIIGRAVAAEFAAFNANERYKEGIRQLGEMARAQADPDAIVSGDEFIRRTVELYGVDAMPEELREVVANVVTV